MVSFATLLKTIPNISKITYNQCNLETIGYLTKVLIQLMIIFQALQLYGQDEIDFYSK